MQTQNLMAAVLLALGATDDEVAEAEKILGPQAIASTPQGGIVNDATRALQQVRDNAQQCLICGSAMKCEKWTIEDGALVAGQWRCIKDDSHLVTRARGARQPVVAIEYPPPGICASDTPNQNVMLDPSAIICHVGG